MSKTLLVPALRDVSVWWGDLPGATQLLRSGGSTQRGKGGRGAGLHLSLEVQDWSGKALWDTRDNHVSDFTEAGEALWAQQGRISRMMGQLRGGRQRHGLSSKRITSESQARRCGQDPSATGGEATGPVLCVRSWEDGEWAWSGREGSAEAGRKLENCSSQCSPASAPPGSWLDILSRPTESEPTFQQGPWVTAIHTALEHS